METAHCLLTMAVFSATLPPYPGNLKPSTTYTKPCKYQYPEVYLCENAITLSMCCGKCTNDIIINKVASGNVLRLPRCRGKGKSGSHIKRKLDSISVAIKVSPMSVRPCRKVELDMLMVSVQLKIVNLFRK